MIAGLTLNIFNNHCDRVRMANLAQCINVLQAVILTSEEKMILTPTYHVMEMYNVHQDAQMIPLSLESATYTLGSNKLKAISASASRDKKGLIHISLVNIDSKNEQEISVDLKNLTFGSVNGKILRSSKLQNHNTFAEPELIRPESFTNTKINGHSVSLKLPPFSVVVLELK